MKSEVKRSMRRKVSNAIHKYYSYAGIRFGDGGFCTALAILKGRMYMSGDRELRAAIQELYDEIQHEAISGPHVYLPSVMLYRTQAQSDGLPCLSEERKERIRRTWLRHWTEVGVVLNHDRWQELQRSRAEARAVRKTRKAFTKDAAALATEPVRDYA